MKVGFTNVELFEVRVSQFSNFELTIDRYLQLAYIHTLLGIYKISVQICVDCCKGEISRISSRTRNSMDRFSVLLVVMSNYNKVQLL